MEGWIDGWMDEIRNFFGMEKCSLILINLVHVLKMEWEVTIKGQYCHV